jgi:hypothetical protein
VTARARSFYAAQRPTPPPPPPPAEPAYPSSFTALASLIASGAPIPGIKQIPERINDAAPATPQLAGRVPGAGKKPWEREVNGGAEAETEEVFPPRIRYIFGCAQPTSPAVVKVLRGARRYGCASSLSRLRERCVNDGQP